MPGYYRVHFLKIIFSQVELLILSNYFLRFISRIKSIFIIVHNWTEAFVPQQSPKNKSGDPDSLAPRCYNTEIHIFPGSLQRNPVTKVPQESSPKVSLHYKKALGCQYAGTCPSVNYLIILITFFQNERKKKGIERGERRRGRGKASRGRNKGTRRVI